MPKRKPKHREYTPNYQDPTVLEIVLSTLEKIDHASLVQAIKASVQTALPDSPLMMVENNTLRKVEGSGITSTTVEVVFVKPNKGSSA